MKETSIERKACDLVYKHLGIEASKLIVKGDTGFPDRVFWLPGGKPFFIEFKKPGEKPTGKQLHIHNQLRKMGYRVEVHDDATLAFQAVIDAVDTTQIPKASHKILDRARGVCSVLRSRSRKN